MRKAPLNYLIMLALVAVLWIVTAVFAGNYLGDNSALSTVTTQGFEFVYRIVMIVAAVATVAALSFWFWYGSRDSAAGDLARARRVWSAWFFILVAVSVGCVAAVIVTFMGESFKLVEDAIMFGGACLLTWGAFWVCSLLMSPRAVKPVPWGMG